jgi:hypothetical protein
MESIKELQIHLKEEHPATKIGQSNLWVSIDHLNPKLMFAAWTLFSSTWTTFQWSSALSITKTACIIKVISIIAIETALIQVTSPNFYDHNSNEKLSSKLQ